LLLSMQREHYELRNKVNCMEKIHEHIHLPHDHGQNMDHILEELPALEECTKVAEIFKQIADGSRLRILYLLCHSEQCVSNIAAAVGMTDPAVSFHLRRLKDAGILVSRREGKEVYYRIADTETCQLVHHVCDEMLRIKCPLE